MQDQPRLLDDLRRSAVPVVAMWQGTSPLEFPTVDLDDRAGIRAGLEHVIGLGHERIAFVSAHLPGDFRQREDAYIEFMTERFGGVPDGYVQRVENTLAGGEEALRALFDLPEPPTAVSTSTDLVAVGVLHAAHMIGAAVPDGCRVVGFDDILIAAHTVPALTTLRMPIAEMVREGVGIAIGIARDPATSRAPSRSRSCSSRRSSSASRPRRRTPDARRRVELAGASPSPSPSVVGIQTRIASTDGSPTRSRDRAQLERRPRPSRPPAVGTAPAASGRSCPSARSSRGSGTGPTAGSTSTSSSSHAAGRSAVSMRVDERPALERDAAADRVDPRVRRRHGRGQLEVEDDRVAGRPRTP